jgi:hypothetical protein
MATIAAEATELGRVHEWALKHGWQEQHFDE